MVFEHDSMFTSPTFETSPSNGEQHKINLTLGTITSQLIFHL